MEFYAIQQRSTGYYLPDTDSNRKTGYTHTEPSGTKVPRLFKSKHAAMVALVYWLRGRTNSDISNDWEHSYLRIERVESRNKDDMEVVKVRLERVL